MIFHSRFQYFNLIAKFVYARIVRGNKALLAVSVGLGVIGRLLVLGGFGMTLQAIVAAIQPSVTLRIIEKVGTRIELNIEVEPSFLVPLLIFLIILVYGSNWIVQYLRSRLLSCLNSRIANDQRNFSALRSLDEDLFIIDQVPLAVQSAEKCLEIGLYIVLVVTLIAFLAPVLSILLLPLLSALVVIQVLGNRLRLRILHQQTETRNQYVNIKQEDGRQIKRLVPEEGTERDAYRAIREHRRHQLMMKPQSDTFIGALAIALIIYYLSNAELSTEQLAGMLILLIIGIRSVVAAGRELSVNISIVLDLRKHVSMISRLLSADQSDE